MSVCLEQLWSIALKKALKTPAGQKRSQSIQINYAQQKLWSRLLRQCGPLSNKQNQPICFTVRRDRDKTDNFSDIQCFTVKLTQICHSKCVVQKNKGLNSWKMWAQSVRMGEADSQCGSQWGKPVIPVVISGSNDITESKCWHKSSSNFEDDF